MSFMTFFVGEKKASATVAKERLQIILAHERSGVGSSRADYLPKLQEELLTVIRKYVAVSMSDVKVTLERQEDLEVLEVKIELPEQPG